MAGPERKRTRSRYSDTAGRFEARALSSSVDPNPISPALSRKIIHCRRCGQRIVSNVSHCPYCGVSILPFYRKLWFWLIIVAALLALTIYLLFFWNPQFPETPVTQASPPVVVGQPEGASYKNLAPGVTVDCDGLLVTVLSVEQDHRTADGRPIYSVHLLFSNKAGSNRTLYATQWMMAAGDGTLEDCYLGQTDAGETLGNELEANVLAPNARLAATIHFAGSDLTHVVYLPDALNLSEDMQVTWKIAESVNSATPPAEGEGEDEGQAR